jgi:hypothetical protein
VVSIRNQLKLDRGLSDSCRVLHHTKCGHLSGSGGVRSRYVTVCTCACHRDCPALGADLNDMQRLCTCGRTGRARQLAAGRAGIKARPRRVIRRSSPGGHTEVHIAFLIGAPLLVLAFVGALLGCLNVSGTWRVVLAVVAVVLGLYLAWLVLILLFTSKVIRTVLRAGQKR